MKRVVLFVCLAVFPLGCAHHLSVKTTPPGASAQLLEGGGSDVIEMGKTPANMDVTGAGVYTLVLKKEGFATYKKSIVLGENGNYDIEMAPVYNIYIDTDPQGARIDLEDLKEGTKVYIGKSPVKYTVESQGPFKAIASLKGFKTEVSPIPTTPGTVKVEHFIKLAQKAPEIVGENEKGIQEALILKFTSQEGGRIEVGDIGSEMPCRMAFYSKAAYPLSIVSKRGGKKRSGILSIYPDAWGKEGFSGVFNIDSDALEKIDSGKESYFFVKGGDGRIAADITFKP